MHHKKFADLLNAAIILKINFSQTTSTIINAVSLSSNSEFTGQNISSHF